MSGGGKIGVESKVMQEGILRPSVPLFVLPALHLALCIFVQFHPAEGSWWWFPVILVDFPFSFLLMLLQLLLPSGFIVFGVFGTLWWYFLGVLARWIFRRIFSK